ncbi:hypothetical protein OQA88_2746 [Cercophora sp. LCS_1]
MPHSVKSNTQAPKPSILLPHGTPSATSGLKNVTITSTAIGGPSPMLTDWSLTRERDKLTTAEILYAGATK